MSGFLGSFPILGTNKGEKKTSSPDPPAKLKRTSPEGKITKAVQAPGSDVHVSDNNENTVYGSCRSGSSSISEHRGRSRSSGEKGLNSAAQKSKRPVSSGDNGRRGHCGQQGM